MEIKNSDKIIFISDLNSGDVFKNCSRYYIVTDESDSAGTNCVNLENGCVVEFNNSYTVQKCNAELRILYI